jgi:quercetin dioxygenase-like cupin family protein
MDSCRSYQTSKGVEMSVVAAERGSLGYRLGIEEGEAYWLLGMLEIVKISGADTDGAYGLVEVTVRAGEGSPWHVHPEEDEWFYVLDGELTVWVADTRLSLTAGSFAFGPKGVPHTFYAEADGARALVGFAPMQFEGFQREVGQPAPERVLPPPLEGHPDVARLVPIAQRNGFEILGPPGPPPGH